MEDLVPLKLLHFKNIDRSLCISLVLIFIISVRDLRRKIIEKSFMIRRLFRLNITNTVSKMATHTLNIDIDNTHVILFKYLNNTNIYACSQV